MHIMYKSSLTHNLYYYYYFFFTYKTNYLWMAIGILYVDKSEREK